MKHRCEVDEVGWVIHGLWPSNWDGSYPQECGGSGPRFDEAAIAPLEAQLDRYWPNSFADTPHTNFWEHEWSKHGTCAAAGSNLTTEREYFATTLQVR
jgi:ribonuclease T2